MNQFQFKSPSQLPLVVKNLMIINGLMFLMMWVFGTKSGMDLNDTLGLHHWTSDKFEVYQFVTHFFMHGNLPHIFFNMFALWMFGRVLENFWGPKRFLTYYIITALGAGLIYLLYESIGVYGMKDLLENFKSDPSSDILVKFSDQYIPAGIGYTDNLGQYVSLSAMMNQLITGLIENPTNTYLIGQATDIMENTITFKVNTPVVGASGAVFGVLLAFGMLFPNTELFLLFFPFPIKAKYLVIGYGLMELFSGLQNNPTDNVAHFAHLGGMLFGFIMIKYWQKKSNNFY